MKALTEMTETELQGVVDTAVALIATRRAEAAAQEGEDRRIATESLARLDALLGPEDAAPYDPSGSVPPSINSLQAHTAETLAGNPGIVIPLILEGLDILTRTTTSLARILGR